MLGRPYRLVRERDFRALYRRGQRSSGVYLLVRSLPNQAVTSRFAVVMSTKVAKSAVTRNRHKRHARAVVEALLPSLPPGRDVLITIVRAVPDRSAWPVFREEVRSLLARRFSA